MAFFWCSQSVHHTRSTARFWQKPHRKPSNATRARQNAAPARRLPARRQVRASFEERVSFKERRLGSYFYSQAPIGYPDRAGGHRVLDVHSLDVFLDLLFYSILIEMVKFSGRDRPQLNVTPEKSRAIRRRSQTALN